MELQDAELAKAKRRGTSRRPKGFFEKVAAALRKSRRVPGAVAGECRQRYMQFTMYRLGGSKTYDKAAVMSEDTQDAIAEAYQQHGGSAVSITRSPSVKAKFCFTKSEMEKFLKTAKTTVANVDANQKLANGSYELFETSGRVGPQGKRGIRARSGKSNKAGVCVSLSAAAHRAP